MKKILIIIIIISLPIIAAAQLTGGGTLLSPYKGTLNSDLSWSGNIYIGGDILTSSWELLVNPGTTIIFVTDSADIKIRGTGSLTADGTPGSPIRFTADDDDDGIYGETGPPLEIWGHISFENSTGNSIIDNCIIEFGSKTGSSLDGYGGGLHANTANLTISNSTFRKNKAIFGGGVFINKNRSTPISNCLFDDNNASYAGGGLYFWDSSSSTVTNCIFSNNDVTASYKAYLSGGGLASISNTSIKVINCTFVNNTSNATDGQSICFYGSTSSAAVINSVFWGSEKQYYPSSPGSTITQNCAIQGATYPTCINLSSGNTDFTGPNFKNPAGSDWSIKVISPCRDAGTTPTPAVANDYIGNPRVRTYDIGAFEVQYNYWLTGASSADWNTAGNWNGGVPTSSQNVVIASGATNYPTGSTSLDYTIGAGYGLVLEPGAKATFNNLTKSGDLKLMSAASGISSLITANSVNSIVELFLTGGGSINTYKWHYISTPVSTLPVSTFTGVTLDIVGYAEPRVSTALTQGWVAWDGYVYVTSGDEDVYGFSNLLPGKGYDYWDQIDNKFTFSGSLNVSNQPISLSYSGFSVSGYNLIGNPFSSGIDWDLVTASGYPTNTAKAIYFTKDNVQYTYAAGTGIPQNATSHIPPMQGFFVRTYTTGNTITIPSTAREHNSTARYKGSKTEIPLIRLATTEGEVSDETVIRFDEFAKSDLDLDFDATKMFVSTDNTQIYSFLGGTNYAINGQPFPETSIEIPIVLNLLTDGMHAISATQLQGLDIYNVYLLDNTTGFTANLKTTPGVTFSANAGTITDRFILKVTTLTTDIESPVTSKNIFNIYAGNSNINIQTLSDDWDAKSGSVKVLDLAGRTISDNQNIEFNKNSLVQVQAPSGSGLYVVEIKSGLKRYVGKVIIK